MVPVDPMGAHAQAESTALVPWTTAISPAAPRSTSTMVTQISPPAEDYASDLISAITHRVVGYACDGSSPTLGIHTNYTGGRTVAKDLIFEGLPL